MTAIGHAAVPAGRTPRRDVYIVRGLLWRDSCRRLLVPVLHLDGRRAYSCGPVCNHPDVAAVQVEQDLLLRVLVRAHFALNRPALVSTEEVHRWRLVNPTNSRAMLVAGLVNVAVDDAGLWHPVWRHECRRDLSARVRAGARA